MKSLFDQNNSRELIDRINKLKPDARAEWGKMNAAQMLAHTHLALKIALEEKNLKRGLIGKLFGDIARKQMAGNERPFFKNLPTMKNFAIADQKNFEEEKKNLIAIIELFS